MNQNSRDRSPLLCEMICSVIAASEKIMEINGREYDVSFKEDASPLTAADIASNEIITNRLRRAYPLCSILSEEENDSTERLTNKNGVFILDPLDGTKEFIDGNGEFCVSLAFAENSRVTAGVIAVPVKELIYYAASDHGSFRLSFDDFLPESFTVGAGKRLHVSDRREKIILAVSRSHMDSRTEQLIAKNSSRITDIITVGSCLKGCLIAEGEADVHYRFGEHTKEWDTAAMEIICRESGAVFTDVHGNEVKANRADPINRCGFRILNHPSSALDIEGI